MIERLTLTSSEPLRLFEPGGEKAITKFIYNGAPAQLFPSLTQEAQGFSQFYWGQIPERTSNRAVSDKLLFAHVDQLETKSMYRKLLDGNRCIVFADGCCAWKQVAKKAKIPYFVRFKPEVVGLAAIWEEFEDDAGKLMHTFKVIVKNSGSDMEEISTIEPVLLTKASATNWFSKSTYSDSLLDTAGNYIAGKYTISPKISDSSINNPELLNPQAPADQFGNYSLFD